MAWEPDSGETEKHAMHLDLVGYCRLPPLSVLGASATTPIPRHLLDREQCDEFLRVPGAQSLRAY